MTRREWALAGLFAVAGGLIVWGMLPFSVGLARIVGGLLLALWAWAVMADDKPDAKPEAPEVEK